MSLMGQGIADAYANAGRIEGQGMAALGQGIAQGIGAVAGAVADYKKMSSQVKADAAAFNSFKDYLPAEFVGLQQTLENDPKASLMDKQQFYQSAKGYLGAAIGQQYKMDQIAAESASAKDRIITGAFANKAAELAGTPTPAMIVPTETGAGIISTAPPVVPMQPSPMQPSAQPRSPWFNFKPRR
jgi:hypothetical protein